MKNRIVFFFAMFLLLSINNANAQNDIDDGWTMVQTGVGKSGPGYVKKVKALHVFNGILIRDSVDCVKLIEESKNFKVKIKKKDVVTKSLSQILGLDDKYYYFFKIYEIKDVILDPETMKLIKIK